MTTTTNLTHTPRARWIELSPAVAATICIFALLMIAALVGRVRSAQQAAAVPTPALAYVYIATAVPAPTAVPAAAVAAVVPENVTQRVIGVFGAPDPATYIGSVEAGRAFVPVARYGVEWTQVDMSGSGRVFVRTADLYGVPELVDLKPAPQPQVVYVSAPAAAYAVSTAEPSDYAVTNADPPADFYAPPTTSLEERQKLIGSDPDALACGGSPMCNGMTNREAQAALDAEQRRSAIQNRLANEHRP